ncbi:MAG: universal stress protein [Deltaproteobacteria bacterium]|jgi:nucleotide-binding universal stress UspA family protein|nr:universal stress protein [Deltaproteobacteria bacterium]
MYGKILVPVDGSETSKRGLMEACRLAREQDARVRCLHVIDQQYLTVNYMGAMYMPDLIDRLRDNGRGILREASEQARTGGVNVESVLRESAERRVADMIIDEAKTWAADLIVMGTHGRRGLSYLALGSDAESVVRNSPVPVLLVRTAS